jgi:hypothetical protein
LKVPDFVVPAAASELEFSVTGSDFYGEGMDAKARTATRRVSVAEHGDAHPTAQETRMFRDFTNQIRLGKLNPSWPEISLKTQRVADACYAAALSVGARD